MADWNDQYSSFDWDTPDNSDVDASLEEGERHSACKKKISLSITTLKANNGCPSNQFASLTGNDRSERRMLKGNNRISDHTPHSFNSKHKQRQEKDEHHMSNYPIKDKRDSNSYVHRDRPYHKDKRELYDDRRDRRPFQNQQESSTSYNSQFKRDNSRPFYEQKSNRNDFMKGSPIFTRVNQMCFRQNQDLSHTSSFKDIRSQIGKTVNDSPTLIPTSPSINSQTASRSLLELPRQCEDADKPDNSMNISTTKMQPKSPCKVEICDEKPASDLTIEVKLNTEDELQLNELKEVPKNIVVEILDTATNKAIAMKHKASDSKDTTDKNLILDFHNSSHLNLTDCIAESQNISISSITIDDHDRGSPYKQTLVQKSKSGVNSRISVVFSDGSQLPGNDGYDRHRHNKQHRKGPKYIKNDNSVIISSPRIDNRSKSFLQSAPDTPLGVQPSPEIKESQSEVKSPVKPIQISTRPSKPNISNEGEDLKSAIATAAKISIRINTNNNPSTKSNNQVGPSKEPLTESVEKSNQKIIVILSNEEPIYSGFRSSRINIPPSVWRLA